MSYPTMSDQPDQLFRIHLLSVCLILLPSCLPSFGLGGGVHAPLGFSDRLITPAATVAAAAKATAKERNTRQTDRRRRSERKTADRV